MSSPSAIAEQPIAIVGMACRLPGARDLDEFWRLIAGGLSPIGELPPDRFNQELYFDPRQGIPAKSYTKIGAVLASREFDRRNCPLPEELVRGADHTHLLMCETAVNALRHAGLDPFQLPLRNTGVYVGHAQGSSLSGDYIYRTCAPEAAALLRDLPQLAHLPAADRDALIRDLVAQIQQDLPERTADSPDVATHMVAGLISRALRLSGPYLALNAACASSPQALLLAVRALQLGRIDMAIVGGASDCKSDTLTLFSAAQSMSATGSRPFDADADGLVCSEGYVALVLKTLDRAIADGDPVQAVIRGMGVASDGHGKSLWAPRKEGQIEAMQRAYRGNLDPASVQYIEAHATSTSLGDATELTALSEVLTSRVPAGRKIALGSVKANLGHTLECAGLTSVVKTVLCLTHRTLPPAINIRELNRKIDWQRAPFYVPTAAAPWPTPLPGQPRRAAVNSFGIGGLNVHMVLEEGVGDRGSGVRGQGTISDSRLPTPDSRSPTPDADADAVAVIGMGCILPGAGDVVAFEKLLRSGRDALSDATAERWPADKLAQAKGRGMTTRGGFVTDFAYDWRRHKVPPKQVAQADPMQFMLLEAADQAIRHAGYGQRPLDKRRAGVLVGTEFGGDFATQLQIGLRLPHMQHLLAGLLPRYGLSTQEVQAVNEAFADALLKKWPALIDETGSFSTSTLASRITKTLDLMGGAAAIDSGDTSAMSALAGAIDLLLAGDCDLMLCAAGQRRMGLPTYEALALAGVLAQNGRPAAPFDATARGFVPGEGVGVLLLKRLPDARRDGDHIYAIIRGVRAAHAATCEQALQLAIERSLETAGARPEDVAVLETDGLALPEHDRQIVTAARQALGGSKRRQPLLLGSAVGQIGHTSGASGMVSLVKAALEVETGRVPPVAGLASPLPELNGPGDIAAPRREDSIHLTTADGRRLAGVASLGKGLAYHVVLERGQRVSVETGVRGQETGDRGRAPVLSTESSVPSAATMRATSSFGIHRLGDTNFDGLMARVAKAASDPAAQFSAGPLPFDAAANFRLAVVADSSAALAEKLKLAQSQLANPAARLVLEQQGVFLRHVTAERPRVAFVFPGQGSQYAGMLRDLIAVSPAAEAMRRWDAALMRLGEPTFAQLAWEEGDKLGSDAWRTQIAMLVADMIVQAALAERGVRPDLVLGHSFGELAALTAAGVWNTDAAVRIVKARATGSASGGHRGALFATTAPRERIEELAAQLGQPVYVANHNAPDQTVVGGPRETLEAFAALLARHSYKGQILPVPAAFHTPLMFGAAAALETELRTAAMLPPRVPVLSSVTNRYVAEPAEIRENLARQLTRPVEWVALIRRLADEGPVVFVEVGPQQALTKLARRILADHEVAGIVACDSPSRPAAEQLACVQALLECCGALASEARAAAPIRLVSKPPVKRGRVVHFDATEVRREKMRQSAASGASASGVREHADTAASPVAAQEYREADASRSPAPLADDREAAAKPAIDVAQLESFLVNFVVEQTGYPPDVVDLDADLEADLGIDSIKKAQMLGELQEYFPRAVQRAEGVTLDDFPTLRHVVNFLRGTPASGVREHADTAALPVAAQDNREADASRSPAPLADDREAAAKPAIDVAQLESFLVNFVVEQTGYPPDVVDLDADLEADLGIDSIKKAQMLGELQEYFPRAVQRAEGVTLDDFPTLRHVVNFLRGGPASGVREHPDNAASPVAAQDDREADTSRSPVPVAEHRESEVSRSIDPAELESFLVNFVVEQTGYPPDVVDLDADLEADLGIDSIKKAQMLGELQEYFPGAVQQAEGVTLDDFPTLRHVVNFLRGGPASGMREHPDNAASPVAAQEYREADASLSPDPPAAYRGNGDHTAEQVVLSLRGTRYEMGLTHGSQLREPIRQALRAYADALDGLDQPPADPCGQFTAEELEELRGIADGAGVPLGNIVAHNIAWRSENGDTPAPRLLRESGGKMVPVVLVQESTSQTIRTYAGLIGGAANGASVRLPGEPAQKKKLSPPPRR